MRIGVIGYGWSGSSALVNFLEKNPKYFVYPGELSFMWDSGGVIDLYKYLIRDYSAYTVSRKLLDFEELMKICSKNRNVLNPKGTNNQYLMEFKDFLFSRLNVEYIELSQRNVILDKSMVGHAVFKVKDLFRRKQYPWVKSLEKSDVLAIFKESLDIFFQELNPDNSVMILDQPCFVDQVDMAVDLLQLDYTYIVSRERSKILEDMIKNNSMYGVIKNIEKRNNVFNSSMDFVMSLELSHRAKSVRFEDFVFLQDSDLQDLFPFLSDDALLKCVSTFNWDYSRSNA